MNINSRLLIVFLLIFGACQRKPENLEPKINYLIQDSYLKALPSPFPPLSPEEKMTPWGQEYLIGLHFAHELDLYQAITAFKRALILIPSHLVERKLELNYDIILSYYLGKKYHDVITTFENSELQSINNDFPACHDLLFILYDSSKQLGDEKRAESFLYLIEIRYPQEVETLILSDALIKAHFPTLEYYSHSNSEVKELLDTYHQEKKSVTKAQAYNALLPGAGYFYLGQTQTGVTALLINGLFIAATYHAFNRGHIAAGVILGGFEAGWYFGGIYGAGEEAKFYNERVYEKHATPMMNEKGYFPVFSLNYAF